MANGDGGDQHSPYTAADKIRDIYTDIAFQGFSKRKAFALGRVEQRMSDHAAANGIALGSRSIYMSPNSLRHARRDSKVEKGLDVSIADLSMFPKSRRKMDLFFDGESYIYTNYQSKFIIHPNYKLGRKGKKVAFVTAGKVTDAHEFSLQKYKKV